MSSRRIRCVSAAWRGQRSARHPSGERALQRALFADLAHGAADPVDDSSPPTGTSCARHPGQHVALPASKPSQCAKIRRQPAPARRARSASTSLGRPVAVADEDEAGWRTGHRQAVQRACRPQRRILQYHEAGEVQSIECAERQQCVGRVGHPGLRIHGVAAARAGPAPARRATGATTMNCACGVTT